MGRIAPRVYLGIWPEQSPQQVICNHSPVNQVGLALPLVFVGLLNHIDQQFNVLLGCCGDIVLVLVQVGLDILSQGVDEVEEMPSIDLDLCLLGFTLLRFSQQSYTWSTARQGYSPNIMANFFQYPAKECGLYIKVQC